MVRKILEKRKQKSGECPNLRLKLIKHTSGSKRNPTIDDYFINTDYENSSPQYKPCLWSENFIGIMTSLINYLNSLKERPVLSIEYDNLSREELNLIKAVFNLKQVYQKKSE